MAITLDGKFPAASGHSWVTGESAQQMSCDGADVPAIAVSANTVLNDNPSLSSRIGDEVWCPQRFVFDRTLKTFEAETIPQIYTDAYAPKTTVLCANTASDCLRTRAKDLNIILWHPKPTAIWTGKPSVSDVPRLKYTASISNWGQHLPHKS